MFNRDANKIYITLLILLLIMSLGVLLPYFYIRIFAQIVKKRKNLMKKNRSENPEKFKYLFKTTKGIFYSFLFFSFAFVFYFSLILIKDYQNYVPRYVYLYLFLFARANSIFNPIIYCTTNTMFKKCLKNLFAKTVHNQNAYNLDQIELPNPNEDKDT